MVFNESNHYTLEFHADQNVRGTMYALTRLLYDAVGANIYGVNAYAYPGKTVNNYIFFQSSIDLKEAIPL